VFVSKRRCWRGFNDRIWAKAACNEVIADAALIVTTFNRPKALDRVLESIVAQDVRPGLVVIVDDGSGVDSRSIVEKFLSVLDIVYCWMPDRGFRAARIRNLGILRSRDFGRLIFVDGDCVLPPHFVRAHLELGSKSNKIIAGNRILLGKGITEDIENGNTRLDKVFFSRFLFQWLPLGILRDLKRDCWQTVRTCNMSVSAHNVRLIQGFDEEYEGWGREDSDFVIRLLRLDDISIRSGRLATTVAHLFHSEEKSKSCSPNEARFQRVISSSRIRSLKSCLKNQ
jgi:glycosyltransferase involved in cell wall biosynthesis